MTCHFEPVPAVRLSRPSTACHHPPGPQYLGPCVQLPVGAPTVPAHEASAVRPDTNWNTDVLSIPQLVHLVYSWARRYPNTADETPAGNTRRISFQLPRQPTLRHQAVVATRRGIRDRRLPLKRPIYTYLHICMDSCLTRPAAVRRTRLSLCWRRSARPSGRLMRGASPPLHRSYWARGHVLRAEGSPPAAVV